MAPEADEIFKAWFLTISEMETHLQKVLAFQKQRHQQIYDAAWSAFQDVRKEVENPQGLSEEDIMSLVDEVMAVPSKNPKALSMRCLPCAADHNILAGWSWLGSAGHSCFL